MAPPLPPPPSHPPSPNTPPPNPPGTPPTASAGRAGRAGRRACQAAGEGAGRHAGRRGGGAGGGGWRGVGAPATGRPLARWGDNIVGRRGMGRGGAGVLGGRSAHARAGLLKAPVHVGTTWPTPGPEESCRGQVQESGGSLRQMTRTRVPRRFYKGVQRPVFGNGKLPIFLLKGDVAGPPVKHQHPRAPSRVASSQQPEMMLKAASASLASSRAARPAAPGLRAALPARRVVAVRAQQDAVEQVSQGSR